MNNNTMTLGMKMFLATIKKTPQVLEKFPEQRRTKDMILAATSTDAMALRYAKETTLETEDYERLVQADARCFRFVPESLVTEKMCEALVGAYPRRLGRLPEGFQTIRVIYAALEAEAKLINNKELDAARCLDMIPYKKRLVNFCEISVRADPKAIRFCSFRACFELIKSSPEVLIKHIAPNLLQDIVSAQPMCLENVPRDSRTKPMIINAMNSMHRNELSAHCTMSCPEDKKKCPICLVDDDPAIEYCSLPCSHIFHETCIQKWFTAQKISCPLCRDEMRK